MIQLIITDAEQLEIRQVAKDQGYRIVTSSPLVAGGYMVTLAPIQEGTK